MRTSKRLWLARSRENNDRIGRIQNDDANRARRPGRKKAMVRPKAVDVMSTMASDPLL
jgi:hypothetical protein